MRKYHTKYLLAIMVLFAIAFTACSKDDRVINSVVNTPDSSSDNDDYDNDNNNIKVDKMILSIRGRQEKVEFVENSSTEALVEALRQAPITINMTDYGNMEKVGSLGQSFPRNDTQITTEAGDVILYQGNMLVIYYAPNSWIFTRLGKIKNMTAQSLKNLLGDGSVTVVLSLPTDTE